MPDRQYSDVVQVGRRSGMRQTTGDRVKIRKPVVEEYEFDDGYSVVEKPHTSSLRYDRPAAPPRRSSLLDENNPKKTRVMKQQRHFDRWTLVTWLCLAIIVMTGGWFVFSKISDWWTGVHDNMVYGTPFRTSQADHYVNLGDTPDRPDHFIALNLHGVIEVVQINQIDSKKDAIYVIANVDNDSIPASLSFQDTTGSGHVDVIVTIGDTTPYTVILVNNGKTLTPTQPGH